MSQDPQPRPRRRGDTGGRPPGAAPYWPFENWRRGQARRPVHPPEPTSSPEDAESPQGASAGSVPAASSPWSPASSAQPPQHAGRSRWTPTWLDRLDRKFRLIAAIAVAAVVVIAGTVLYIVSHRPGTQVSAVFTEAVGVYPGSDVRVLGVKVGTIDSVQPRGTHVLVTMTIEHGVSVPASADAVIVAASVIADRYVQLTPPYTGGPALASGAVIPASRTAVPVEIDQIYSAVSNLAREFGPNGVNKNGALSDVLKTGAANLAGNGKALGVMIDRFGQALHVLSGSQGGFFDTIDNLQKFTTMLKTNDSGVRMAEQQLVQVSGFLAADRQNLAAALHELAIALGQVRGFIQDNRAALKTNISRLSAITKLLVNEQASLAEAIDETPLALDNLLNAYDPATGTFDSRGDLLEITSGRCSYITNPSQTGCPHGKAGGASGQSSSALPLPALGTGTVPGAGR
jgi:phospholipid/cholesterol/gamma-HCH transport system substrate-binding protein